MNNLNLSQLSRKSRNAILNTSQTDSCCNDSCSVNV